jgi:hypothetical protein
MLNTKLIEVNDEAKNYGKIVIDCMARAQEFTFKHIAPELELKGKASCAISTYWNH